MKIVADADIPFVKEAFAEFGPVLAVPGREISPKMVSDATILAVRSVTKVNRELLEGSRVEFVGTATIGFDHIDLPYLQKNSIGFASAPGSNAQSVAEYVTAALLHIAHMHTLDLTLLTLGIVGVGNVGTRVHRMATAMGTACVLCDPPKQRATGSDVFVALDELLGRADIVTMHVPLTAGGEDATQHMVNESFLSKMKQDAILINTSRGKVVDEAAVRKNRGKLKAFVADVWEDEPSINCETMNNADIATPHIAGYSFDGKVNGIEMIHQAACAFFFRDRKWHSGRHVDKRLTPLDISQSKNPLYDAVIRAYPITDDDKKLREIAGLNADKQGAYFDKLRKEYPKRREFNHFSVICGKKSRKRSEVLKGLGFVVKEED